MSHARTRFNRTTARRARRERILHRQERRLGLALRAVSQVERWAS